MDALDRPITVADLEGVLERLDEHLDRAVALWYNPKLMAVGENQIARKLAEETARELVHQEIRELKKGAQRTLRGLEIELKVSVDLPSGPVSFYGKADRIDWEDGQPVVIDYKSGKVVQDELKLGDNWVEKLSAGERPKALQLLIYSAIALRVLHANGTLADGPVNDPPTSVRSGIRSGRRARSGLLELDWQGSRSVTKAQSDAFLQWVSDQLAALYAGEVAVLHSESCRFCPYCVLLDPPSDYF